MAKARPGLVNANGGEVSRRTLARADLQNYSRYAEEMENVFPELEGGFSKAPGTKYIGTAAGAAVLRPFEFAESSNCLLELTATAMKIIVDEAYLTLEGADATLGAWSDESAAPSTGGGTAPDLGSGDLTPPSSGGFFDPIYPIFPQDPP